MWRVDSEAAVEVMTTLSSTQGLDTRNAYTKTLFMLVFHALDRFHGSPNVVCPSTIEWFGIRDGLQEGNRLQDKSQQIMWLMAFGDMLPEWRGPGPQLWFVATEQLQHRSEFVYWLSHPECCERAFWIAALSLELQDVDAEFKEMDALKPQLLD